MSEPMEVQFEGAPQLGYMSLAQLHEFAIRENVSPSPSGSKQTATAFFLSTLRLSDHVADTGTGSTTINYKYEEADFTAELSVKAPTEDDTYGYDHLINLDTLSHLVKAQVLRRPRKSQWTPNDGRTYSTRIGAKQTQLAADFIERRARFLGMGKSQPAAAESLSKEDYRARLSGGDIVYLVEGEDALGGGAMVIKKGTVEDANPGRRYPNVLLWQSFEEGPGAGSVTKSPRQLFTNQEIKYLIRAYDPSLLPAVQSLDEALLDPIVHSEVVGILGSTVIQRLLEDEFAHPGDPER